MANFNNLALTTKGLRALLAAQAGTTLTLSKIGMGSGFTDGSIASLADLVVPEIMLPISESRIDNDSGYMSIVAKMTNEDMTEGFYWRETGLFFEDSEGNDVLFAYSCISDDQYDYVPAFKDKRYVKHIRIANIIKGSVNITIKENEGLLYVDSLTFEKFKEELDGSFSIIISDISDSYSTASTYEVGDYCIHDNVLYKCRVQIMTGEEFSTDHWEQISLAMEIAKHFKNTDNPHGVTAEQIGAAPAFIDMSEYTLEEIIGSHPYNSIPFMFGIAYNSGIAPDNNDCVCIAVNGTIYAFSYSGKIFKISENAEWEDITAKHTHGASDIQGILPVGKGGTGASDRAKALLNLANMGYNPITSTSDDTVDTWKALGNGFCFFNTTGCFINQPAQYCMILNYTYVQEVVQLCIVLGGGYGVFYRKGNNSGWCTTWKRLIDNSQVAYYTSMSNITGEYIPTCDSVNYHVQYRLNRSSRVNDANTAYTTYMARGIALVTSAPSSLANGCCAFVYQ